jgi:hypothetical protein
MKATTRFIGMMALTLLVPAMAGAQGHDMSKMGKDTAKKDAMAGMKHDMPGMKHDMSAMQGGKMSDSAMKAMMKGMKPGAEMTGWKELDAFHGMMQATWHGAMDNDLRAAKAMSGDVVKSAEAWVKSAGPAGCDNATLRKALPGIVTDARAYDAIAKSGTDADVKAALRKVHDGFEQVAMPCMKGMKH